MSTSAQLAFVGAVPVVFGLEVDDRHMDELPVSVRIEASPRPGQPTRPDAVTCKDSEGERVSSTATRRALAAKLPADERGLEAG